MKKLRILSILLLLLFVTGCDINIGTKCEHDFEITRIESTCVKRGVEIRVCKKCGYQESIQLDLKPHTFVDEVHEPTCKEEGYTLRTCSVCGKIEKTNIVPKTEHNLEFIKTVPPTCKEEGYDLYRCTVCNEEIKKNFTNTLDHTFVEKRVEPTCVKDGYILKTCKICGFEIRETIPAFGHNYGEWKVVKPATEKEDGLKERTCLVCGEKETLVIPKLEYTDLSVIKYSFDKNEIKNVKNMNELQSLYNAAVLNMTDKFKTNLDFKVNDFNQLLNDLVDNCSVGFSYSVSASIRGKELTLSFTFSNIPTKVTPNLAYTQYGSLNYNPIKKIRDDNFNDFKINSSAYSYNVSTSDQLYYVLERGVKPICKKGSMADNIYNIAKDVLRNIIDDKMTDLEKVKAIHDYLIMTVTYDNDLLEFLYNGETDLKAYNGFYLEGVFLDHKAVCEGISKAFTVLANIEGIPCVSVEGYQSKNPGGAGHAWNKINVDGKWYIIDATSDGTIINSTYEILSYEFFLIDEKTFMKNYTGTTYVNLLCNSNLDYFNSFDYNYENITYDYNITSQKELDNLVIYFKNNGVDNSTIQFKVDFFYGISFRDELNLAFNIAGVIGGYSFINEGNIYTLVR